MNRRNNERQVCLSEKRVVVEPMQMIGETNVSFMDNPNTQTPRYLDLLKHTPSLIDSNIK